VKTLIVIVWTLLGLVAGVFALGFFGEFIGISAREGQLGFFAVFVGAPIGACAGFAAGFVLARHHAGNPRVLRGLLGVPVAIAAAAVLGGYLFETIRTWDDIDDWGGTYSLSVQIRLPAGAPSPAGEKIGIQLFSAKENPECKVYDYPHGLTREDDRYLVSASCELRYAVAERTIGVRIADGPTRYFKARVKARPESRTFSDWYPPDQVKDNTPGAQFRAPRPDEIFEIRYGAR
jgi:hypothetical protein